MKTIPVGKHHTACVDDCDFDDLIQFTWFLQTTPKRRVVYAAKGHSKDGDWETMHTRITGFKKTDHKDGNGLNNQRSNLRQATHSQNKANAPKYRGTPTSQFKGVSWHPKCGKWLAQIKVNNKTRHLGYFDDEVEAARAYDTAALHHFGEFAHPNFRE